MSQKVTLEEIAQRSEASLSTVSLVLRNKPGVGAKTRERVLAVAKELGYQQREPLPVKRERGALNIGLVLRARSRSRDVQLPVVNPFYSWVLTGIEAATRQQRYNLLYATVPVDDDNRPLALPRHLLDQALDGLLLVGSFTDETVAELVGKRATPVVLVDAPARAHRYDAVASDNQGGAYAAVSYLIRQGHRAIALVDRQPPADANFNQRGAGYHQALREHGLAPYVPATGRAIGEHEVAGVVTALLRQHPEISAIFGINDAFAIATIRAAPALGRRVPDNLSVIGFDDIELSAQLAPALTTMAVDKVSMGRLAIQLLRHRLAWPDAATALTVLQPRLIERQSVARRQ